MVLSLSIHGLQLTVVGGHPGCQFKAGRDVVDEPKEVLLGLVGKVLLLDIFDPSKDYFIHIFVAHRPDSEPGNAMHC